MEIDDVEGTCKIFREAQQFKYPEIGYIAGHIKNILSKI
jgi:hypothetical protein